MYFGGKPPEAPQLVNEFPAAPAVVPGGTGTSVAAPAIEEHRASGAPGESIAVATGPGSLRVPLPRGSKDHKALIGRIVDAYDPAGVAVVKVYVVDYDETWQRLQVVLEKSSFVDTNGQAAGVAEAKGDGELVAVLTVPRRTALSRRWRPWRKKTAWWGWNWKPNRCWSPLSTKSSDLVSRWLPPTRPMLR